MIVLKVGLVGNTKRIQASLMPQTPQVVRRAGTSEMPKPRMYPDITLHRRLKEWASMTSIRRV
mgnify:CR=1 FL=1